VNTRRNLRQRDAVDLLTLALLVPFCAWLGWWGVLPSFGIGFAVNCWYDLGGFKMIKHAGAWLFWHWPFGDIYREPHGKDGTTRVAKNLWVFISDGKSTDALPLTYCSQEFVDRVVASVQRRWWYLPPDEPAVQ
jgi:hypothetical protein